MKRWIALLAVVVLLASAAAVTLGTPLHIGGGPSLLSSPLHIGGGPSLLSSPLHIGGGPE
jgi:hypothetical protein